MECIRKKEFSLNFCHPFRACGKKRSVATQRPESSEDEPDQRFFSAIEFCRGKTYTFISPGLKSYFVNDAPRWVWFMTRTIPCGVGQQGWAPCCSSNWSVSLGSQFVPVKPFSYLLHAPRVAKVEAQRQYRHVTHMENPLIIVYHQRLLFHDNHTQDFYTPHLHVSTI